MRVPTKNERLLFYYYYLFESKLKLNIYDNKNKIVEIKENQYWPRSYEMNDLNKQTIGLPCKM